MSWWNPNQEEANEAYYSSRNNYLNAAAQKQSYQRAQENYMAERSRSISAVSSCTSDKINFEKRVEDLAAIIGTLEGTGGLGGVSVPDSIADANAASSRADEGYKNDIQCSDASVPDLSVVFKCKSVEEDASSREALELFKAEKVRLESAIQELEQQIQQGLNMIDSLTSQIQSCAVHQSELRNVMLSNAYTMEHFRRYM